jgi:cytochrome c5
MKNKITFCLLLILSLIACSVEKKIAYDFPEAMLPEVKVAYKERCDKGQALYNIACSGCHNKGTKRKPIVPDFTADQLRGYALRVSNKLHEKNMPDSLVSEEELGIIMTFLSYKRKNS